MTRIRFLTRTAWSCAWALAAACGVEGGEAGGTVFRDSAGIAIAENDHTRPAWKDGTGLLLSPEPLIQVGGAEEEGPEQFLGVVQARLLANGSLAVVSSRLQRVALFDSLGGYTHTIGRNGDGPGEFRSPWHVYQGAGDSVLVVDIYRSVSVFGADGGYARRFVPGDIVGETQGAPIGQFGDGTLMLIQYQHGDETGRVGLARTQVEPLRVGLDGAVVQRFGKYEEQTVDYGAAGPYLFGPWGKIVPAGEGFWYGPADRWELHQVGTDGRITRLVRFDLPARQVTASDVEGFKERWLATMAGSPQVGFMGQYLANATAADYFPAHDNVVVDDEGRIWVEEYLPGGLRVTGTWHLFDRDGRYLGVVQTPVGFTLFQVANGKAVGRWTDEDGVEFVRVYRVRSR